MSLGKTVGDEGQQIGSGDAEKEVNKSVGLAGGANFFFLYKKKKENGDMPRCYADSRITG